MSDSISNVLYTRWSTFTNGIWWIKKTQLYEFNVGQWNSIILTVSPTLTIRKRSMLTNYDLPGRLIELTMLIYPEGYFADTIMAIEIEIYVCIWDMTWHHPSLHTCQYFDCVCLLLPIFHAKLQNSKTNSRMQWHHVHSISKWDVYVTSCSKRYLRVGSYYARAWIRPRPPWPLPGFWDLAVMPSDHCQTQGIIYH